MSNKRTILIMEADKNPFPKMDLFPRITRLARFAFSHITSPGLSDHFVADTEVTLDKQTYVQGVLEYGADEQTV